MAVLGRRTSKKGRRWAAEGGGGGTTKEGETKELVPYWRVTSGLPNPGQAVHLRAHFSHFRKKA